MLELKNHFNSESNILIFPNLLQAEWFPQLELSLIKQGLTTSVKYRSEISTCRLSAEQKWILPSSYKYLIPARSFCYKVLDLKSLPSSASHCVSWGYIISSCSHLIKIMFATDLLNPWNWVYALESPFNRASIIEPAS